MTKLTGIAVRSTLISFLGLGMMSASDLAGDLSRYRTFQFGTNLATIAKQVGASPSRATVVHRRPALIQQLEWRPQPLAWSSKTEPVQDVVFSFYDGKLFRIAANYDRYETEGLSTNDIVEAISVAYGTAEKLTAPGNAVQGGYGEQEEIVARWQNSLYCFDLIRSSYSPSFRLIGISREPDAHAQAAILEAKRLDDQEAPQRETARIASEEEAAKAKLEKARLVNKPKFRP